MTKPILMAMGFLLAVFLGLPVSAAESGGEKAAAAASPDDSVRAKALLDRAVRHYRENGDKALSAFSLVGEFIDGDLYVYVVGEDGMMQASGGPSTVLVGRDVRQVTDAAGKLLFKEIIEGANKNGGGSVEYRWLNRDHGKVERKVAYYRKEGKAIIAVGYYIPRAAPQAAISLLDRAVAAIKKDGKASIARFSDMNGGFIEDDLYVFVVGLDDRVMHAHGAMPRLIGRNVGDLKDNQGKPIIQQMIDIVKNRGRGELQYSWQNPVTGKQERKTTYLQRVDGYLVAVGHYER